LSSTGLIIQPQQKLLYRNGTELGLKKGKNWSCGKAMKGKGGGSRRERGKGQEGEGGRVDKGTKIGWGQREDGGRCTKNRQIVE
jgi:hypothetical protein